MNQEETPRHAEVPEKLSRFVANPVNREKLKQILREPAFIAAMNLLCGQNKVDESLLFSTMAAPDIVVIRKAAYHAGVSGVYERLEALTQLTKSPEEVSSWDHITPNNE